jgi:MFS family permease
MINIGIVTAGTGIGSITFGPLAGVLFKQFEWKWGLFIFAVILLTCAVCCAFMRPLKPIRKRRILPSSHV